MDGGGCLLAPPVPDGPNSALLVVTVRTDTKGVSFGGTGGGPPVLLQRLPLVVVSSFEDI